MSIKSQNIWAVGKNYQTSNSQPQIGDPPIFFLKAGSCLTQSAEFLIPKNCGTIFYELELALLINENFKISHITLALDLTARDMLDAAKKSGQPWTSAKSFIGACPLGAWQSVPSHFGYEKTSIQLEKNGKLVQSGTIADMINKPKTLLDFIASTYPIIENDIVLTGTPSGAGPIEVGDHFQGKLFNNEELLLSCSWTAK